MAVHVRSFIYGLLAGWGVYALKRTFIKLMRKGDDTDRSDKCIFFSPTHVNLNSYSCIRNSQNFCNLLYCPFCNYKIFRNFIKSTQTHLDICVYLITLEDLARVIVELFKKGVFVRIITDKQISDEAKNSKVNVFIKNHIPIKIINVSSIMHNKFVIIDKKKLITGSFNWTRQGVMSNFENAVIIQNTDIVNKYDAYFQTLWLTPFKVD